MSADFDNLNLVRDLEQAEAATAAMASLTAAFFKNLVRHGITRDEAVALTAVFVGNLNKAGGAEKT